MRTLLLGWIILALLLLGLGRIARATKDFETAGFITATDQEAEEGYFGVGPDAVVVVKQDSGLQRWLKVHTGQRVRLVLVPDTTQ